MLCVLSSLFLFAVISEERHPHDIVFPFLSCCMRTIVMFPQSHWQRNLYPPHRTLPTNSVTTNLPNLFPIGCVLHRLALSSLEIPRGAPDRPQTTLSFTVISRFIRTVADHRQWSATPASALPAAESDWPAHGAAAVHHAA